MATKETAEEYAQRRANETGTPYLISGMGHVMAKLGGNARLMRDDLGGIAQVVRTQRGR